MANEPTQPMMGSQLYDQVSAGFNMNAGGLGGYSGGAMPNAMPSALGGQALPGGLGGFAMPQMNPMGAANAMGQMNPFGGGGSSPFGGGGGGGIGGANDSLKKLVDTNKDLIAAIKDLTKNIKGLGGGGPGGMPGGMGSGIGAGGADGGLGGGSLADRLLHNIARNSRRPPQLSEGAQRLTAADPRIPMMEAAAQHTLLQRRGAPPEFINRGLAGQVVNPAYTAHQQALEAAQFGMNRGAVLYGLGGTNNLGFTTTSNYNGIPPALPGGRMPAPGRFSAGGALQGAVNFGYAMFGQQAPIISPYRSAAGDIALERAQQGAIAAGMNPAQIAQTRTDAFRATMDPGTGIEHRRSFAKGAGRVVNAGARIVGAGGTNMSQIVSQIPYVGGIMAAPLNVLENRLGGAIPGELPGIQMSGYGLGGAQGSGFINTHSGFIRRMTENLGVGAVEGLSMGNQVLNLASGQITSGNVLANRITAAYANGVNPGDVGVNAAFGAAGANLSGTGFGGTGAIRMALGMGLRGQGVSDFLGAVGGLGGQFSAMGIDLGAGTMRDISSIHSSGFSSLRGKGAVEGYSRMRQKGGIAAAQSLGGIFSGVGQELLMANALDATGGNFDQAGRMLENMSPFENRRRLAQMLGVSEDDEVVQMMMMGQGLSYAERHIKEGSGTISSGFSGASQPDAIFTRTKGKLDNDRLRNTYGENRENIRAMLRINKRIEDILIDGITVKKLEDLVTLVAKISNWINWIAQNIADIKQKLVDFWNWITSDERLKWDVVEIGKSPQGFTIYQWKYKTDIQQRTYQGVMAQEVMKVIPQAVKTAWNNYLCVDYTLLDVEFKEIA